MIQKEISESSSGQCPMLKSPRKLRAAMVSYSFYEFDARVKRYAETLARRGDHVDVISLRRAGQDIYSKINGVQVFRIQERERNEKGRLSFLGRLIKFFVKSSIFISRQHLKIPYDLIHVHSVPDFEVFAAFLPKLLGTRIILDIHDLVPEFYASKFNGGADSLLFKTLVFIEKASGKFADHVIISNHIWENVLVGRSIKKNKCSTVLNYPDPSIFYPRPRQKSDEKIIMIYPGSLHWHQGVDIAINAFQSIKDKVPEAEFHIYGGGKQRDYLVSLIQKLGLQDRVIIKPYLPLEKIADLIAAADIGVVPKRNDPFGGEAFSTKILEFMTLGVPVIVSRTKIDEHYFNESVVKFFTPEDVSDLADAMLRMIKDRGMRESLVKNASSFAKDFSWEKRKREYLDLVDRLANRRERMLPS